MVCAHTHSVSPYSINRGTAPPADDDGGQSCCFASLATDPGGYDSGSSRMMMSHGVLILRFTVLLPCY